VLRQELLMDHWCRAEVHQGSSDYAVSTMIDFKPAFFSFDRWCSSTTRAESHIPGREVAMHLCLPQWTRSGDSAIQIKFPPVQDCWVGVKQNISRLSFLRRWHNLYYEVGNHSFTFEVPPIFSNNESTPTPDSDTSVNERQKPSDMKLHDSLLCQKILIPFAKMGGYPFGS